MSAYQRTKGKRHEQDIARKLRAIFGECVKRGWQARTGSDACDVEGTPFHVECAVGAAPPLWQKLAQAERDASPGRVPVVFARRDREEGVVLMREADFLELIREWTERTAPAIAERAVPPPAPQESQP